MDWLEDIRRTHVDLSPLWLHALELEICPKCHCRKHLYHDVNANGVEYMACVGCGSTFILDE